MTAPGSGKSTIGVRVRPNSHDFIRHLRQDLATKKFTFWVDVRARTNPATRDVREWASTTLKNVNAKVPVSAKLTQANKDMTEWRTRQRTLDVVIPVKVDTTAATRDIMALRALAERDITIRVNSTGGTSTPSTARTSRPRKAPGINEGDDGLLRVNPARLADIQRGLDKLKGTKVDVDTTPAQKTFRELLAQIEERTATAELDLDTKPAKRTSEQFAAAEAQRDIKRQLDIDLKKAKLQMLQLRIEAKSRDLEVGVRVKRSGVDSVLKTFRDMERNLGSGSMLRSLDFGPITLGKPTGLLGTVTTITALAGAVPGAVAAITSLSKAITDMAGAASIAPGAIGALLASIATIGVATNGVGDTFGAMFDMWSEGASEQVSSANSLVSAHNSYRNAVVDEAKAQEDVGRARRDALGDLRDLNNELRGSVLNEAQAILDAQKARDRYAQGLAGGFDNETDRMQGLLDIAKADENIINVRERNIRLQDKVNEANRQGVDGSERVTDALEAQTRAAQATAQAAASLAEAGSSGATTKFNDMLAQLSPNAQDAVLAVAGLRGEIKDFKLDIQDTFFEGVGPGLQSLFTNLMPIVGPGMRGIAAAMNNSILTAFDTLESGQGQSIIQRILGGTEEAQNAVTRLIDPAVRGVGTLMAAGAEHLPQVVDLMGRLLDRFANFIEEADRSGALDDFMDRGVGAMENLAELGINAVKIIGDLGDAFEGDLLKSLVDLTDQWHEFLSSDAGQERLKEFLADARDLWNDWRPVLEDLPELFGAASDAAKIIIDLLTPFINLFSSAFAQFPGLVTAFVGAWLGAKVLVGALSPVLTVIGGLIAAANKIPGIASALSRIPGVVAPGVATGGGPGAAQPKPSPARGFFGAAMNPAVVAAVAPAVAMPALVSVASDVASKQEGQPEIDAINAGLPTGSKPIAGFNKDRITLESLQRMADSGDPMAKWIMAAAGPQGISAPGTLGADWMFTDPKAEVDLAKRYAWALKNGGGYDGKNFTPPPSYEVGGYTDWDRAQGRMALLHGKEYIQPADVVSHYGLDTMKAMHERKIPREFLRGFQDGGQPHLTDPRLQPQDHLRASEPNPAGGGLLSALNTGINSATATIGNVASGVGSGPAPGPGVGTGPLPGPAAGGASMNLFGFDLPIGNTPVGWGPGGAPVGLGGGADGFDMRKFGIGPGPAGSTPSDWMKFGGNLAGEFITGVGSTLLSGVLGGLGISGISKNITQFSPLLDHFLNPDQGDESAIQGAGAAQTNADVQSLLNTYGGMPLNPMDPTQWAQMPGVFDSSGSALPGGSGIPLPGGNPGTSKGGEGGLQRKTIAIKRAIEQMFPQVLSIGGYRQDALQWHPSGRALDVMVSNGGNNDKPTPPQSKALGDAVYNWAIGPQGTAMGVYPAGTLWQTRDHYNHVHVALLDGGGYPDGSEPPISNTPYSVAKGGVGGAPAGPVSPHTGKPIPTTAQAQADSDRRANEYRQRHGLPPLPKPGAPAPAGSFFGNSFMRGGYNKPVIRDKGGWIGPGITPVVNLTGQPELVVPGSVVRSFAAGGYNPPTGARVPRPPLPRGPQARTIAPPPVQAKPMLPAAPKPSPITTPPQAPPVPPVSVPTPPVTPPPAPQVGPGVAPGPSGAPIALGPQVAPGGGPGADSFMHLNPAIQKGITSGFATAGSIAGSAASMGLGGMGGGLAGGLIEGMFGQAGKIASNVANVAASFLVGNITGGTTENSYGVTQRGNIPSGGTRMVDASSVHNGDVYTNNLDEYFARTNRREAQKAQANLGRWGKA